MVLTSFLERSKKRTQVPGGEAAAGFFAYLKKSKKLLNAAVTWLAKSRFCFFTDASRWTGWPKRGEKISHDFELLLTNEFAKYNNKKHVDHRKEKRVSLNWWLQVYLQRTKTGRPYREKRLGLTLSSCCCQMDFVAKAECTLQDLTILTSKLQNASRQIEDNSNW